MQSIAFNMFPIIILVLSVQLSNAQQSKCSDQEHSMYDDLTSKVITIGDPIVMLPENSSQVKQWCSDSYKHIVGIENYKNKCLSNLSKQVTGLGAYAMKGTLKGYCKSNSRKGASLIASAECFNFNKRIVDRCYFRMIDELQGAQGADDKVKIPHFCCSYYRSLDCIEERLPKRPKCNLAKINDLIGFYESAMRLVTDLLCSVYSRDSDSCERLGLPPKKRSNVKRTKSMAVPLMALLLSFAEI